MRNSVHSHISRLIIKQPAVILPMFVTVGVDRIASVKV